MFGSRGEPDKRQIGAADTGVINSGGIWGEFIFGKLCEDEVVDLGLRPGIIGCRWSGIRERFKRPELAVTFGDPHLGGFAPVLY